MKAGNQNGKGSARRKENIRAVWDNWDEINWGVKYVDDNKFQEAKKWAFNEHDELLKKLADS